MSLPYWTDPDGTLHEIYTGQIYIGTKHFGPISYDSGRSDLLWHRCSYAFFCRFCGEVWARIVMSDSRGEQQAFEPVCVSCKEHSDFWNIPGSLLANHLERLIDSLPPAALRRELELLLEKELA